MATCLGTSSSDRPMATACLAGRLAASSCRRLRPLSLAASWMFRSRSWAPRFSLSDLCCWLALSLPASGALDSFGAKFSALAILWALLSKFRLKAATEGLSCDCQHPFDWCLWFEPLRSATPGLISFDSRWLSEWAWLEPFELDCGMLDCPLASVHDRSSLQQEQWRSSRTTWPLSLSFFMHGWPIDFQNKHLQWRHSNRQSAYSSLRENFLNLVGWSRSDGYLVIGMKYDSVS